ncbi:uncharacterized protein PITG_08759 [Phytophthora infestans T30-4]|uniref:Uncharacterized protein n=1 Tax=Phytophthora infestans (strain T30-4) TaxID=403677 RepID=D0ND53_PHYIT|nr:uncharacterized protein PITG_08759 [Phytophthora infestans T30-4]EEY56010.1 conserved hypothetical protein [Phytophthora infestans T30-4]|eukprot:XP_002902840.1 conserved hypothetical protein [Phytophthora infestans T30-4]
MYMYIMYYPLDAKISYIGRRAELALYSQAFSAWEYRNPQTLSRRLHSLVVKLHLNNLAALEDAAFAMELEDSAASRKRKGSSDEQSVGKRARSLFFDGNRDLLQHVCSFLGARDVLQCAATSSQAASQLPAFVTSIEVTTVQMMKLSSSTRSTFFQRFPNLKSFSLSGRMQAQQFNFQDEKTLVARNVLIRTMLRALSTAQLPKLEVLSLNFCYSEGLKDHVTSQIATVLAGPSSNFPRLHTLSLVGNCISDDGVMDLYDAIALPRYDASPLALLDLSQNFIGERGHVQMQELVTQFASRGSALIVNVMNNLLTAAAPVAPMESFQ